MKTTFGRRIACGIALAAALQAPAHAWDKSTHGTIAVTEVTAGQNFGYRVWLDGEPALCSNGLGWGGGTCSRPTATTRPSLPRC